MEQILLFIRSSYDPALVTRLEEVLEIFTQSDESEYENRLTDILMTNSVKTQEMMADAVYEEIVNTLMELLSQHSIIFSEDQTIDIDVLIDLARTFQQLETTEEYAAVMDIIMDPTLDETNKLAMIVNLVRNRDPSEVLMVIEDVSPMLFIAMIELFKATNREVDYSDEKPESSQNKIRNAMKSLHLLYRQYTSKLNVFNMVLDGLLIGMPYDFYNRYLRPMEAELDMPDLARAMVAISLISSDVTAANRVEFLLDALRQWSFEESETQKMSMLFREMISLSTHYSTENAS